ADDQARDPGLDERLDGRVDEHVDERLLDARGEVRKRRGRRRLVVHALPDRRLETAEAEVEARALDAGAGEADRFGVSLLGEPLDRGPARVAEPQQLGDLVERLADGVVPRAAEAAVVARATHQAEAGVAARDDEAEERERDRIVGR